MPKHSPWKKIYGKDRKYTRRVGRALERDIERTKRTDEDQLNLIIKRTNGKAASGKEAARLRKRIRAAQVEEG